LRFSVAYVFNGSATSPRASVAPSNLSFGSQAAGATSASKSVTLTNTGTAPLKVSGVAVTSPFTATQNCNLSSPIAPGSRGSEPCSSLRCRLE
jgi:hypothetical protein